MIEEYITETVGNTVAAQIVVIVSKQHVAPQALLWTAYEV
jgi:hypothetical protein